MALAPDSSTSAASDLQTVNVVSFSKNPKAELYIDALQENGAEMLKDTEIQTLQDITRQKLAVIFDQDVSEEEMTEIIEKYEKMCEQDPLMSLRFFCLKWDKEISNTNDRLRIIDIKNTVLPAAFPARMNRALFKTRLPAFLRKNYNVDISDTLEEINWIQYRPITIRSYKKWDTEEKIIDHETERLYIHDKCLFLLTIKNNKPFMKQITEKDKVWIKKFDSKIPASLSDLDMLLDAAEEE